MSRLQSGQIQLDIFMDGTAFGFTFIDGFYDFRLSAGEVSYFHGHFPYREENYSFLRIGVSMKRNIKYMYYLNLSVNKRKRRQVIAPIYLTVKYGILFR